MKKLLIYLLLIACFESFIFSTPSYCWNHKTFSNFTNINTSVEDKVLPQDEINAEIHPLDIFSSRYF